MSYQTDMLGLGRGDQFFDLRLRDLCQKASAIATKSDKSRVYFIEQVGGVGAMKIGFTAKGDATDRLSAMQSGNPQPLRIMLEIPGAIQHEELLHCVLVPHWLRGEWFTLDRISAGFIETMRTRGLTGAMSEYARDIHDKDHAKILRRTVKEACAGPVHNLALTNWGKSRNASFESKQTAKTLNHAALGWQPRVISSGL